MATPAQNHRDNPLLKSELLASLCKAAGDPLRLDILRVLSHESFGVQELALIFAVPQPGMSHHLKILAKAGLVVTRRQGNIIFYRRALHQPIDEFYGLFISIFATIDDLPLSDETIRQLTRVYEDRASQSRLYFARNVDKFAENQGMLCEAHEYLPNLKEILDMMALPQPSRVMEVGPGQGELLKELSKRFHDVTALDDSREMLAYTRGMMVKQHKIKFVQCAFEDFDQGSLKFDAIVLNMVLHHLSSPPQAFHKARQLLSDGGFLVIADLCLHHQEWVKTACGDVWLGFDPIDLHEWAAGAGFAQEQSLYLGLKNGFQIQIKLFRTTGLSRSLTIDSTIGRE